ncbi:MAG: hypothetical protein KAJ75_00725 [Alphaproteobacteria bacterium]|nr:hypothetical protein [Alphaproteobacteria bacterium]
MVRNKRTSATISNRRVTISGNLRKHPTQKLTAGRLIKILLGSTLVLYGLMSVVALFFTGKITGSIVALIVPMVGLFIIFHKPAPPTRKSKSSGYATGGRGSM